MATMPVVETVTGPSDTTLSREVEKPGLFPARPIETGSWPACFGVVGSGCVWFVVVRSGLLLPGSGVVVALLRAWRSERR